MQRIDRAPIQTTTNRRLALILVDPFFARGLATCHDDISLPNRGPNQMQNQHSSLRGFFTHDFNCVCRSSKARDNLSSFVISMRTDQDRCISCAPFYAGFFDPQKCPSERTGGSATGFEPFRSSRCGWRRMTAAEWRNDKNKQWE